MMQAMNDMKSFDASDTRLVFVRLIIHLNLILFNLHNTYGYPNPEIKDSAFVAGRLKLALYTWSDLFKDLSDVPDSLKLNFYTHFFQADDTLQDLAKHIPK